LEPILRQAARLFPAVVLTGPRQSGKTTILKHVFGKASGYVSLEAPDVRAAAAADPRGFLEMYPPPVIFGETEYAPGLLVSGLLAFTSGQDWTAAQFDRRGARPRCCGQHG
jgi:hypothetical protein